MHIYIHTHVCLDEINKFLFSRMEIWFSDQVNAILIRNELFPGVHF